jgi:transcriptional regulator with XRE-family HTH domain
MKSSMKLKEIFSNNVRKYRIEQNLSQEELAEKAGLHRTYIGSVERGERNITINVMEKICIALNIPIIDLLKSKK